MIKVIKIGGKLIEDEEVLRNLCIKLAAFYPNCILVHGGGALAGQLAERLGVETTMIDGRRVADKATLDITIMAYAGLANKKVVACLQAQNVNACGISGCDMGVILSHKRLTKDNIDWGFVGDIDEVKQDYLLDMLERKIMPVVSPITYEPGGQLLNTNADSVASAVATAISQVRETELVFCFDKPGVLTDINDNNSVIPFINPEKYAELIQNEMIHSGMLPKLENAFQTLQAGVKSVRLTSPDDLNGGTVITL
ncbi:MAG: acetylglutamate kinase [Odoribacter sp.]|nr:acetylglutamate kinase [Odoribacter sp.]